MVLTPLRTAWGARAHALVRSTRRNLVVASVVPDNRPPVLITGSSTGIGRATALRLSRKGWQVFAGVLKESEGEALVRQAPSIAPLILDVTSDESTAAAVAEVSRQLGDGRNLAGLVNNAGIGVFLPLEVIPMDMFDSVMAVNVSGVVRVTKAALPLLRKSRPEQQPGRIVNLGSYAGTVATPLSGPYAASKFGLEALSDVMRYELGPKWGIRTVLIKAGGVKTPIWRESKARTDAVLSDLSPQRVAPYTGMIDEMLAIARDVEKTGLDADDVAEAVESALTAANPKTRYLVGNNGAELQMTLRRLLPDWLWDRVLLANLKRTAAPLE